MDFYKTTLKRRFSQVKTSLIIPFVCCPRFIDVALQPQKKGR